MRKCVRTVGVASAAVAFGAGSALAAPGAGAQSELPGGPVGSDPCGENVVTPTSLASEGWFTPEDETAATIAAVEGAPESVGDAALTLPTSDLETGGSSLYKNAERAPLGDLLTNSDGDLEPLSFEYTSEGQPPALQIRLNDASVPEHADSSDDGFATIVWSPEPPADGWSTAEPGDSEDFWVTRPLEGPDGEEVPRGERMTLAQIVELSPEAVVTEYGVQKTRDNTAEDVAVDNVTLGCETTNFELDSGDAEEPEGSLGDLTGSLEDVLPS